MRHFINYTIFVCCSLLVLSCKSDSSLNKYNDIYSEYFIPNQISILSQSNEPKTLLQGQEAYNQGNYGLAAGVLLGYEPILEPPSRLAYAISLIKTNQEENAIAQLIKLEPIPLFNDAAYWYQGLLHLKKGDTEKMKIQFEKIKEGSWYKPKTLEIISQTK